MADLIHIKDDQKLTITGNGSKTYTIVLDRDAVEITYDLKKGDYAFLIYRYHCLKVKENFMINKGVNCQIIYLDVDPQSFDQESTYTVYKHAKLNISSIYLGSEKKRIAFDITNAEGSSEVLIDNSLVALKDSDILFTVTGNIIKGAHKAIHHQKSRCLTIDKVQSAVVKPILNIDENDVMASHSMAIGTIDDEVLYYLNSRGLNKKEAMTLLIDSYLSIDHDIYVKFKYGEAIEEAIVAKEKKICLM